MKGKKLLEKFIGSWIGEGTANGQSIKDELVWRWTLDQTFLSLNLKSVNGDRLKAEGYLWYNKLQDRVEFYEFNNGSWPVRIMVGKIIVHKVVLEEKTAERHVQVTLELENDNLFKLTEVHLRDDNPPPFVEETFRRKPRK